MLPFLQRVANRQLQATLAKHSPVLSPTEQLDRLLQLLRQGRSQPLIHSAVYRAANLDVTHINTITREK